MARFVLSGIIAVPFIFGLAHGADRIRVACVGDSITFGARVKDRKKNSYPAVLGRILGDKYEVKNFGVNGATMLKKGNKPYWKLKTFKQAQDFKPSIVVIKLGTNDTKPNNWKHKDEYAKDYEEMIKIFKALPSHPKIWVVLPVPAYPGNWGISDKVIKGEVIPLAKEVAKKTSSGIIDAYTALSGKSKLFPDKVHPNVEGAKILAETVAKAIGGKTMAATGFPGKAGNWKGFTRYSFNHDGRNCFVVTPKKAAPGNPWVWRARFFGHEPQTDIALLNKGFHVVYMDVANLFGSPTAVAHWDAFYKFLTENHDFASKAALEGMSRGGLIIYNWAKKNPDKVSCIYADAPVCDIRSWPGGKGKGKGGGKAWDTCLKAFGITDAQSAEFKGNPIDGLEALAQAHVPALHVCGASDTVVPMAENTNILAERYRKLGGLIRIIAKANNGHHPHSFKDPSLIVNFILRHTFGECAYIRPRTGLSNCAHVFKTTKKGRVAFIGGSITEMEGYRPRTYKKLQALFPQTKFDFINAGISSTCSTTGAFRLQSQVLAKGQVDLLFIEFAVNDDQDGNLTDEECIRAMEGMVLQARRHNPKIDIVFLYTANQGHIKIYQSGKVPHEIAAHEKVAAHYGIPAISFAGDVAERIEFKEFDWKKFGGCHPKPFGNDIYASDINCLLKFAAIDKGEAVPHPTPAPVDALNYSKGRFIDIKTAKIESDWSVGVPNWKKLKGGKRDRFTKIPMLEATKPGATLTLPFEGTAVGIYIVAGPDAGCLDFSIDGGEFKSAELYHHYSRGLHYPCSVTFADNLTPGKHTLKLRVSEKLGKGKGAAARIIAFEAN